MPKKKPELEFKPRKGETAADYADRHPRIKVLPVREGRMTIVLRPGAGAKGKSRPKS